MRAPVDKSARGETTEGLQQSLPWNRVVAVDFPAEKGLQLFERTGMVAFGLNVKKGELYFSRTSIPLFGYTHQEFTDDPRIAYRLLHPDSFPDMLAALSAQVKGQSEPSRTRLRARSKKGDDVWLDVLFWPQRGPEGAVTEVLGVGWDATGLVQAESLAQEGRNRYRRLFEEAPLPMLLFDPDTLVVLEANLRACQLYGTERADLEDSFVSERVVPDDWPLILRTMEESRAAGKVNVVHRTRHRKGDGTVFPAQVAAVGVMQEGKERRLAIIHDLSAVEAAEDAVRQHRRTVEEASQGVLVLERSWVVAEANAAAAQAFGLPVGEVEGRMLPDLFDPLAASFLAGAKKAAETGKDWRGLLRRPGGEEMDVAVTPIADSSGEVAKFLVVCNSRLAGPAAAFAPADAALFFDLLAHDVTNYLTAVVGYLELVRLQADSPESARRLANVAQGQAQNALDLIRDTRRVVSLNRDGGQAMAREDLLHVLDDAVRRVEPILPNRRLRIRKEVRVEQAPIHHPDLLREVFVNLLHNAVKYDAHREVLIDLTLEKAALGGGAGWRVRLADRGGGIPDRDKAHVFERGFRSSAAAARAADAMAPQGSGIGLSVCKLLIERCGGTVEVESRIPGDHAQGTVFVVTLPSA